MMPVDLLKEYDATLDTKHRITVRNAPKIYKNYHVRVYTDGRIQMEPRILIDPKFISKRTLRMMDSAMKNISKGIVSGPVNTEEMRKVADDLPD
jgi:hypothetical protein